MLDSGQHKKKPPPSGIRGRKNKLDGLSRISKNLQIFSNFRLTKRPEAGIIAHVDRLTAARQNRIMGICIVVVR